MRGDGRIFQRAEFYWVAYYLRGKEYREAAKTKDGKNTTDPKVAEKFLRARLKDVHADEVGGRAFTTPKACRLTVHDLVESLKADYELRGKLSAQNASYLKHVQSDFGEYRAVDLTAELRIPGDICKNRKPRVLPLGSELARIIERRRLARRAVIKGVICMDGCEFIFHRGGKPVGEFRKSWHSACVAAGLGKIACTGLRE
jgi:hypothetical protein